MTRSEPPNLNLTQDPPNPVDDSVPTDVIAQLRDLDAEIKPSHAIGGQIAGMFWRFLVADDAAVDRYIVRDTDSRLNARERFAVEEWIESGKVCVWKGGGINAGEILPASFSPQGIHSIRDHPNHDRPLNGGLWGGKHGAIKNMGRMIRERASAQKYGMDLTFLNTGGSP